MDEAMNSEPEVKPEETAIPEASPVEPGSAESKPVEDAIPAPTPARDKFNSRIAAAFPDETIEGDDAVYEKANSHLDRLEDFFTKGTETNQKLATVLNGEPELDGIVRAVIKGMPIRAAIAKYFAPEDLVPVDGEPDHEEYNKYASERSQRITDKKKFEDEVAANLTESETILKEFASENNLTDEQAQELIDVVSELMGDLYKGKLPKNLLGHVHSSRTKSKDIEAAAADAELKGKNAKIEAVMAGTKKTGDNIPVFNGGKAEEIKEEAPIRKSRLDSLVDREMKRKKL